MALGKLSDEPQQRLSDALKYAKMMQNAGADGKSIARAMLKNLKRQKR